MEDQTALIPKRATLNNICHLFLNIQTPMEASNNGAILTLDAMKAFVHFEWNYLWRVLRKMGFGPNFVGWVELLYKVPMA